VPSRLPKENLYTVRCAQCGSLILLSGDELLESWEPEPIRNRGYKFICPGCCGKTSHTTSQLLMTTEVKPYFIDIDDYNYAMNRALGHGIILEEGDRSNVK